MATAERRPGGGGASDHSLAGERSKTSTACADHNLQFRRLVRHVHELGPRPVGVLLLQIAGDDRDLIERLERLAAFDPQTVAALGGRDWPRPPLWSVPSEA